MHTFALYEQQKPVIQLSKLIKASGLGLSSKEPEKVRPEPGEICDYGCDEEESQNDDAPSFY